MVMTGHVVRQSPEVRPEQGSTDPLILQKKVHGRQDDGSSPLVARKLSLMMLGCEDNPPYGPTEHTGKLFLELIAQTLEECISTTETWVVTIAVYRVKIGEYPEDWDAYDGIILPGSFNSAYDAEPWIDKLKHVIQDEIVKKSRPTMAICFGHQVLADSFDQGHAKKYKEGTRAGRYAMATTEAGATFFGGRSHVQLYYTHGDMVDRLPSCAVALGQEGEGLPVQSAAYFKSHDDAHRFQLDPYSVSPYAISFQAHPEYSVSRELGLDFTLGRILNLMVEKNHISKEFKKVAGKDAEAEYDAVHRQSKDAFIVSAKALGWFP
jgi:GMP synthase-like glutamine amidotransferase